MKESQGLDPNFLDLSARLGNDPLQVQGAGGNTSIKTGKVMWIKASGKELSNSKDENIFVKINLDAAKAETYGNGDGSCKDTIIDPSIKLRPSIETTFHAILDWPVVTHTHSVVTLVHAISPEGLAAAESKLEGLPYAIVSYIKPGLPLTRLILEAANPETQILVLKNHGLICCGETVLAVSNLIAEVEKRLAMPERRKSPVNPSPSIVPGYTMSDESWISKDPKALKIVRAGSYYPDHVVFLGPSLTENPTAGRVAFLVENEGIYLKSDSTKSQKAMLRCLSDILLRLPSEWNPEPIGACAEAELMNWDAEKYRQSLDSVK